MAAAVPAAPKQGVKEFKEVTEAVLEISLRLVAILKDGYQPTDLALFIDLFANDPVVKAKIGAAYEGISKVGGELKDLDAQEGVELGVALLMFVPKIIELFKKDKP